MRFECQTQPQDDHIDIITDYSTRYGQAYAVSTRVKLAKGRCMYIYMCMYYNHPGMTPSWHVTNRPLLLLLEKSFLVV